MCSKNIFSLRRSTNQSEISFASVFAKLAMWGNSKMRVFSSLQILWFVDLSCILVPDLEANFFFLIKLADKVAPHMCEMCLRLETSCLSSAKRAVFSNLKAFAAVQLVG